MEPMTLGSPGNISDLNASLVGRKSSPFLPSFLLGSDQTPLNNSNNMQKSSPDLMRTLEREHNLPTVSTPLNGFTSPRNKINTSIGNKSTTAADDAGRAFPVVSLRNSNFITSPKMNNTSSVSQNLLSKCGRQDFDVSDTWVTVFGFPESKLTAVKSHFAQFGNIVDTKHTITNGNWVHIKYSTQLEAAAALSQNGKVICSNIMVGVVPHKDQNYLWKNETTVASTPAINLSSLYESPQAPAVYNPSAKQMRSLTLNTSDFDVQKQSNIPTRSTSVVSKTMDYLFGW